MIWTAASYEPDSGVRLDICHGHPLFPYPNTWATSDAFMRRAKDKGNHVSRINGKLLTELLEHSDALRVLDLLSELSVLLAKPKVVHCLAGVYAL